MSVRFSSMFPIVLSTKTIKDVNEIRKPTKLPFFNITRYQNYLDQLSQYTQHTIEKTDHTRLSIHHYLNPSKDSFQDWPTFMKALKHNPFYVNRCLTVLWQHDSNFQFLPYKHVVDTVLKQLKDVEPLNEKQAKIIHSSTNTLLEIQSENRFGFNDVNHALLTLLSLKSDMINEANSQADKNSENTFYTIDGLYHIRIFSVDELQFSDLDNPGLVSLIGISFDPFNYDDVSINEYMSDGIATKSLRFAKHFALHDIAHSEIIELRIVRSLESCNSTTLIKAIPQFIDSQKNYEILTNAIDVMEDGIEKRAMELVKFNMGHEDTQAPNFWSKNSLEIFLHLCQRNLDKKYAPKIIEKITERLRGNFEYPERYKHSSDQKIIAHIRPALFKIIKILDVPNNYIDHAHKIAGFF